MTANPADPCPCGSGSPLASCCQPYLRSERAAPTPEALMRSRYTAHVLRNHDYLDATQIRERPHGSPREAIEAWNARIRWLRLEVLSAEHDPAATEGTVEFAAHYLEDGQRRLHHECSGFSRESGRWLYTGAIARALGAPQELAVGRNDPCPCGSGKKFKKCCLRDQPPN